MPDLTPSVLFNRLLGRVRLKHLQLAIGVADLQSLHRAAASIGLSQPAATHALAELESALGGALFERHAKGMRLTGLGEVVLPLLRAALVPIQAVAGNAALMQQGAASAPVRIGSIAAGIHGLLAVAIPAYCAQHPQATLEVQEVTGDNLLESIQEGALDLAICRAPGLLPQGFGFRAALHDRFVVVCRAGHPLAGRAQVEPADLLAQRWLAPPLTGLAPQQAERLFDDLGAVPALCRVYTRAVDIVHALLTTSDLLVCLPLSLVRTLVQRQALAVLPWAPAPVAPLGVLARTDVLAAQGHPASRFIAQVLATGALAGARDDLAAADADPPPA